jgi:hypothetical protein
MRTLNGLAVSTVLDDVDRSDALMLQVGAGVFARHPMAWSVLVRRYEEIKPVIGLAQRFLIDAPLQCLEQMSTYTPGGSSGKVWELDGPFLDSSVLAAIKDLPLHNAIRGVLQLRLAVFFDAPLTDQLEILRITQQDAAVLKGIVYEPELIFLSALVALRSGEDSSVLERYKQALEPFARVVDWKHRLDIIEVVSALKESWIEGLVMAEAKIEELNSQEQHPMSGESLSIAEKSHTDLLYLSST